MGDENVTSVAHCTFVGRLVAPALLVITFNNVYTTLYTPPPRFIERLKRRGVLLGGGSKRSTPHTISTDIIKNDDNKANGEKAKLKTVKCLDDKGKEDLL
jgi:hypothetical protein